MKAPDKKYPLSVVGDLLASMPPNEVVFMPDKIYFDGVDTSTTPRLAINEEYIRKDALIKWLKEKLQEACNEEGVPFEYYENGIITGKISAFEQVINTLNSI